MVMRLLPYFAELRDERRDRIREADAPVLDQHHHRGRRRDDLGERGQIEDGVDRHRLGHGLEGAAAIGAAEHDGVTAADQHDRARQAVRGDGVGDDGVNSRETNSVEGRG